MSEAKKPMYLLLSIEEYDRIEHVAEKLNISKTKVMKEAIIHYTNSLYDNDKI